MCDGNLNVVEGHTICVCPYCDTQQTVPSDSSEKKVNLFNRANRLRSDSEFDKAASVYENIVAEFKEEAEAYWGLCLCKYGIEYVDDPNTGKKMPTCHRTSYDSIFDDKNFDQACEYADSDALPVYRAEAKEIDRLQKEILEIAKNEEPFDVFICYKETAEDGNRTKDSVLAQDIFEALASKGYKVFFARITLEDKLGQDYEPYIFSALNSAKVMLAIGTRFEHFNAVWVKNEWSRFLSLMQNDKSKTLIPCYCDIDAYDMPKEFSRLQGQDMSKVGFIQDLVRGVGKIIPRGSGGGAGGQTVIQVTGQQAVEPLLERAFMFLGNNDWQAADDQSERVLDIDPHCGRAYLVKLLVQYNCRREEELANLSIDVTESIHYKNARQFGVNIEQYVRKAKYNTGCRLMADCSSYKDLKTAKMHFEETYDIENSPEKLALCEEKIAEADEITNDLQRVYGSFDPDCHTENNEALTNVREMRKKIETTYPKFVGGKIKEPWSPAPVAVWFIPLGIGLLVFAFFALFKPMVFNEEYIDANNDYSALIAYAAPVISIIVGYVGFAGVRKSFSILKLILIIVVSSFLSNIIFGAVFTKLLFNSLQTIGGFCIAIGLLLVAISALLITLYLKKSGFIKRYYRDSETLEKLAATMKNKREAAILAELAKHPDFKQSFLEECVSEALATYKSALGVLPNPASDSSEPEYS
ncbi:MAG: TIR domain-containing protein [Oscillospiraceae bacterium]|nr:TIR domain-containing protein [Oscillospiraceae bacterium]